MSINYFNLANKLKKENKWQEALEYYKKATEQNPHFYFYFHNMGEVLTQLGCLNEAVAAYNRAIEINPNYAWSHHNLGRIFVTLGDLSSAILEYRIATEISPKFYFFYYSLGEALYQLSLQINTTPIKDYSHLNDLLLSLSGGTVEENEGNLQKSWPPINDDELDFLENMAQMDDVYFIENVYERYLNRTPDVQGKYIYIENLRNGMSRQEILNIFRDSHEYNNLKAETIILLCLEKSLFTYSRCSELNPQFPKSYEGLIKVLTRQAKFFEDKGELAKAIDSYKQIIFLSGDSEISHYNLGISLFKEGRLEEAIISFKKVMEDKELLTKTKFYLGSIYTRQGKLEQAIEKFEEAINLDSMWADAYQKLGDALLMQKQFDRAIEKYKLVLAIEPNWAGTHVCLGNVFLAQGKIEAAISEYREAIAILPSWNHPRMMLGYTLEQQNKLKEALESYEEAILNDPNNITLYNQIGSQLYVNSGDLHKATDYWKRGLILQQKLAEQYHLDSKQIRYLNEIWVCRIGHIALLSYYAKMAMLGWLSQKITVLFAPSDTVANSHYLKYLSPYFQIITEPVEIQKVSSESIYLQDFLHLIRIQNKEPKLWWEAAAQIQQQWEDQGRSPILNLSDQDREKGWCALQKMGVSRDSWFVCLHVREPGFHKEFIDYDIRNASIDVYSSAIDSIIASGGWVIRMGDSGMKEMPPRKQLIDYAHSEVKSDWMDIFLCAECRFFIGTNSGLFLVPASFGVPCVWTNWIPLESLPWESNSIFIPKLFVSNKNNRYMTFAEQMSSPLRTVRSQTKLSNLGINAIDNTPEEIQAVVDEMLDRLDNNMEYTEKDNCLQSRFRKLAKHHEIYGVGRIGRDFLYKYSDLL